VSAEMRMVNRNFSFGIPLILGALLVLLLISMALPMINTPANLHSHFSKEYENTHSVLASHGEEESEPTFVDKCSRCGLYFDSPEQAHEHLKHCLSPTACDGEKEGGWPPRGTRPLENELLP
jgi:hypothetical protein